MNRKFLIVLGVLIVFGLAWFSLIGYINSRSTDLHVSVAGGVDEVTFYEASRPDEQVATIVTNGGETRETLRLPNTVDYSFWRQMPPAEYHFITRQGDQTYDAGPVCCPVGLRPAPVFLNIRGLGQWERTSE
jgi:hypothetical protein